MGPLVRIKYSVRHFLNAQGIFRVHSPFVYTFYSKVLLGQGMPSLPRELKAWHRAALHDRQGIGRVSAGARGEGLHEVSIGRLMRREAVSCRDAGVLYRLAHFFQPSNVLELGTCLGFSSAALAAGAPRGRIITLDMDAGLQQYAQRKATELGLLNISYRNGRFSDLIPSLPQKRFDMVFIDGDHQEEHAMELCRMLLPWLIEDGVLVLHDIHWSKGMATAWERLRGLPEVTTSITTGSMGFLFTGKRLPMQAFRLRW